MFIPMDEFSRRAQYGIRMLGATSIEEVMARLQELEHMRGVGQTTLKEIHATCSRLLHRPSSEEAQKELAGLLADPVFRAKCGAIGQAIASLLIDINAQKEPKA